MYTPTVDFSKAESVFAEIFDDDRWVKDQFSAHLSDELNELAGRLAGCFALLPALNAVVNNVGTIQAALVGAFAFGVIDDVLISTKLLVIGKLMPAGNLMRQAIEGIAVALLCSSTNQVVIQRKKKVAVSASYWKMVCDGDSQVRGHYALAQLSWNRTLLGVSEEAINRLTLAKEHYNTFSHAGTLGIASRMALGTEGQAYAGGHFDIDKLEGYHGEVRSRIELSRVLPELIKTLTIKLGG